MEYRKIKNQEVSLLGFGCMRLPMLKDGSIDEAAAFEMFDYAYQNGVNYYDTAYIYHEGESELVLGKWLKTIDCSKVCVATKLPLWDLDYPEYVNEIFEEQLNKLGVEYIDFYLLHSLRKDTWDKVKINKAIETLSVLVQQGKIKYLGFSFHGSYDLFEEVIATYPWDFCQIQVNYMDEEYQAGIKGLNLASKLGIKVVVMEPLKGGLIAKLPDEEKEILVSESNEAELALRWVAMKPGVAVILSGMSKLSDVKENTATLKEPESLNEEELSRIKEVVNSLNGKILVECTTCGYCIPCDFGVDIPGCFKYLNVGSRYNNFIAAQRSYGLNVGSKKASNCVQCGVCTVKCPQQLAIPELLQLVVEKLEN